MDVNDENEIKKISVIVPVYNEEEVIEIFYRETSAVLKTLKNKYDY